MIRQNKYNIYPPQVPYRKYLLIIIFIFFFLFNNNIFNNINKTNNENNEIRKNNKNNFDFKFSYDKFQSYFITDKIRQYSGYFLQLNDAKFINGLIRKRKPKKCLEIGVAYGGSSILILNALKDIKNSYLVSLDLNNFRAQYKIGYIVKEYFPELTKNWKLFTGDQPHKFLVKLNMKFDFLFLDSAHLSPGELLNFIEALPFLNENATVVIHDILWHFGLKKRIYPSNINLFPAIYGDKILLGKNDDYIGNIGAVFLYPNQKNHYLDYFLLLLNLWEYMPKDNQINDLRIFIKEYYKNDFYLKLFNIAVKKNSISIKTYSNLYSNKK